MNFLWRELKFDEKLRRRRFAPKKQIKVERGEDGRERKRKILKRKESEEEKKTERGRVGRKNTRERLKKKKK